MVNTMIRIKSYLLSIFAVLIILQPITYSQKFSDAEIKKIITSYKTDSKGPYKAIRWFCTDGTTVPPDERCPQPGGVQRATYKDDVIGLQKKNHIYIGQILAATPHEDFWDESNQNSRISQYMIERFLINYDNGWVLRKAQYYRGSVQVEDEENWGVGFFNWLLSRDEFINSKYFLIRQAAKYIPHRGDDNKAQSVRALSKQIAEQMPSFMDIRVKIHGRPDSGDVESVKEFREKNKSKISPKESELFDRLTSDMEYIYRERDLNSLKNVVNRISPTSGIITQLNNFIFQFNPGDGKENVPGAKIIAITEILYLIRSDIINYSKFSDRLALLDLSIQLEELLFNETSKWNTISLQDLLLKNYYLCKAAAACGFIEKWEWKSIEKKILTPQSEEIQLGKLIEIFENSRRVLEWGAGMVKASFEYDVKLFEGFEPIVHGFTDDQIRASVLLPIGRSVSDLGNKVSEFSKLSNKVLDIEDQNNIRGLNPGIALGELQIVTGSPEDVKVDPDKIYVFSRPPSDLKPVAGIATITEGNLVSHVQLLARNLGIPNSVITQQNLNSLKKYSGEKVFYAVSRNGTVIMKLESQMTPEEKKIFTQKKRSEEIVSVPLDKLDLLQKKVISLNKLRAGDSGKLCGPKAANLGQLKALFPSNVVEGFVIPFGIFKAHMDQIIPGKNLSYWNFLKETFENSSRMEKQDGSIEETDKYILSRLEILREEIKKINLQTELVNDLDDNFSTIFGIEMGKIPVFIRSDTNMEDLKDFSGAGLNLTVFNAVDKSQILQGIRDVWASPYTERSYKWRQKYLNNPLNVFPSILIIPSVNVDKSGVIITTGVTSANRNDITIAFSMGAGGAVEGQISESYLIKETGEKIILSPSRESRYNYLPVSGGVIKKFSSFENPVLSDNDLKLLIDFTNSMKVKLPGSPGIESDGPFDIELGIKDSKIWLFQVRPFVENKAANSLEYLNSITQVIPQSKKISLSEKN